MTKLTLKDAEIDASWRRPTPGGRYLETADREVLRMCGYGGVEFVTAGEFLRTLLGQPAG